MAPKKSTAKSTAPSPLKSAAKAVVAPKDPKPATEKSATEKSATEEPKAEKTAVTAVVEKVEEPKVPPVWPRKIDFKALADEVKLAASWDRTALVVCNGKAKEADTFFTYSGYAQIDAKWVLAETAIKKTMSVEEMQEDLRRRVVGAMKHGLPVHVAMANSAVSFKEKFCSEKGLPACFFKVKEFKGETEKDVKDRPYRKMVKDEDLKDWPGMPGYIKEGFHVVVTTDFSMESCKEFLTDALPFLEDMANNFCF